MSVALSTRGLLLQDKIGRRIPQFIRDLTDALRDPRFIWVPLPSDYLTAIDKSENEALITWNTAQPSRISRLGDGIQVSFNATTDGGTAPNNTRYSFNVASLLDLPFSVGGVVNATVAATTRTMLSKYDSASNNEWRFIVNSSHLLDLELTDASAAVACLRASSSAITEGALQHFVATYSGLGGATAMNGATLYANGAVIASTATNQATYVAMENHTALLGIGRDSPGGARLMNGMMGLTWLCGVQLSAAEIADIYAIEKDLYAA